MNEENYIAISTLNDFIFCPYSIYLHSVYMDADDFFYKATPQIAGKIAHVKTEQNSVTNKRKDIISLQVYSNELGVVGEIDIYRPDRKQLIERKNKLKVIYRGHLFQLWAQYFCMIEMGYEINSIAFHEISTNKIIPVNLPTEKEKQELKEFILKYINYVPDRDIISINLNKCLHCIYCNLCDKIDIENVYT